MTQCGHTLKTTFQFLQRSDVQVTRDLAPVVYHDFLTSETGIDAPAHTITYEQVNRITRVSSPA